ncbi:MAG: tetratricopeptide repeat protein [bacterium]
MDGEISENRIDSWKITLGVLVLLCLLAAAVYSNSFSVPFVFDDGNNIKFNYGIQLYEFSRQSLNRFYETVAKQGRTLAMVTFALNFYFGRLNVFGYHLVNLIIHILNGLVVFLLVREFALLPSISRRYERYALKLSILTAVFFIIHPVQTQAVTYVVQRMASLAALFYFLSLWAYLKWRLKLDHRSSWLKKILSPWFMLMVVTGLAAFTTKQNTVVLPFIILLTEFFFFQDFQFGVIKRRPWIPVVAVVIMVAAAMAFTGKVNIFAWVQHEYTKRDFTMAERVMTEWRVLLHYLSLLVYPEAGRLILDYTYPLSVSMFNPPITFFSLLFLYLIGYLSVSHARREPLVSFFILWFFINLALESSFLGLDLVNEHRLYLPGVGFFVVFSFYLLRLRDLLSRRFTWLKNVEITLVLIILMVWGSWTHERNKVWHSVISILEDVVAKAPDNARQHINLGVAYSDSKQFDKAIRMFIQSMRIKPDYPEAYNNLGNVYNRQGKLDKAIQEYVKAIRMRPTYREAYNNMGTAYLKKGNPDKALEFHLAALKIDPYSEKSYNNLGVAYTKKKEYEKAIEAFKKSISLKRDFIDPINNLGLAYRSMKKYDQAISTLRFAISQAPNRPSLYFNLGDTYANMDKKHLKEAEQAYLLALRINPYYMEACNNLGLLYLRNNKNQKAADIMIKGLKARKVPELYFNLGLAYRNLGRFQESLNSFQGALNLRPVFPQVFINVAEIFISIKNYQQALASYRKAAEQAPNYLKLYSSIERIYKDYLHDKEGARQYFTDRKEKIQDPKVQKHLEGIIKGIQSWG